jgi:geranylgeranyl diphosphate synthase type II
MNDFLNEYKQRIELIDTYMHSCLDYYSDCEDVLFDSMCYSVFNGGKRIRSILCVETARMLTGSEEKALPFAAAIEFIHAFSLVHDDLPCMDNADMRRSMPSCHKKYGEAIALLAGDALLNTAFEVMADECEKSGQGAIKAMKSVGRAAGVHGMINGQIRDIELMASPDATEEKLIRLIEQKTMALIRASIISSAYISGCDEKTIEDLEDYSYHLGLAFQIRDDILDLTGDEAVIGKPVHSDEKNNKKTYVTVNGIDKSEEDIRKFSKEAKEIIGEIGSDDEERRFLTELIDYLVDRNK